MPTWCVYLGGPRPFRSRLDDIAAASERGCGIECVPPSTQSSGLSTRLTPTPTPHKRPTREGGRARKFARDDRRRRRWRRHHRDAPAPPVFVAASRGAPRPSWFVGRNTPPPPPPGSSSRLLLQLLLPAVARSAAHAPAGGRSRASTASPREACALEPPRAGRRRGSGDSARCPPLSPCGAASVARLRVHFERVRRSTSDAQRSRSEPLPLHQRICNCCAPSSRYPIARESRRPDVDHVWTFRCRSHLYLPAATFYTCARNTTPPTPH